MDGWTAALLVVLILGTASIAVGLFALYQKNKEIKNQD